MAAPRSHAPSALAGPTINRVAIIDVDNIVLAGHSSFTDEEAHRRLVEVDRALRHPDLILAVMSHRMARQLNGWPWFALPHWTWRTAANGPDAADHQLVEFADAVAVSRSLIHLSVASGDHIFADVAFGVAWAEVVVPSDHIGVAQVLEPLRAPAPKYRTPAPRVRSQTAAECVAP